MSSVSIERAKEVYGGSTEAETLARMAAAGKYRRIYKYKGRRPEDGYTDYKRIQEPGDAQERAMWDSPSVRDPILVYDRGFIPNLASEEETDKDLLDVIENLDLERLQSILDRQPKLACVHVPKFVFGAQVFMTPLMWTIVAANRIGEERGVALVELLLQRGALVNATDLHDGTALDMAAGFGQKRLVALLLAGGADVNSKALEPGLHRAAVNGHVEVMELLLAHGANVHGRNHRGETALDLATRHNKQEAVQILINHGAKSK